MHSTAALLDAIRRRHKLPSDYQLARMMGWTTQQVSNYRAGRRQLGDDVALAVAKALDLDPGYVLAIVAAERAASAPVRAAWRTVAERLAAWVVAVGVVYVACALDPFLSGAQAASRLIMSNALTGTLALAYACAVVWSAARHFAEWTVALGSRLRAASPLQAPHARES